MTAPLTQPEPLDDPRSEGLALLLASGQVTDKEAGRRMGLSEGTVSRRKHDLAFTGRVRFLVGAIVDDARRALVGGADLAVQTLTGVMNDADAPAALKVQAALGVLGNALKFQTLMDLQARVEAIERKDRADETDPRATRPAVAGRFQPKQPGAAG